MKKLFCFSFFFLCAANVFAQKETFDIITFTVPQGWDKKPSERAIQFSKEDAATGTYCLITLYKSVPGTASSKENFDLAWSTLIKESVTVSADPEMQAPATEDGWEAQSGYAKFESEGSKGIAVLVTSSGFQKMVNIVILTNTDEYEKDITEFLESVSFQKPVAAQTQDVVETQQAETTNVQTNTSVQLADNEPQNNSISGTWGKGNSATLAGGSFGRWSYTKEQYIFNQSGAYSFARKVYVEDDVETLLTRETGTYTISGNKIIINPKTNVIEAWSKINGGDNFKQLISSQKKALEKTTYQFTVQYNMELKDTFLVLIADKETARDGWSNAESIHSPIAWRYGPTPPFTPIKMPN